VPTRIIGLLAVIFCLLSAIAVYKLRPLATALLGLGIACFVVVSLGALFVLRGVFPDPFVPGFSVVLSCLSVSLLKLSWQRQASRRIRAAFSGRVSAANLKALLASPEEALVKGGRRVVTCLSASAKGIAASYGSRGPQEIVELLGAYHTAVGVVILSLGGTLERARADSLFGYFGAPQDCPDHVGRSCRAALRITAVEKELDIASASPLATRIGIDTAECIVGALGSPGAPEYAVVGSATDLAARLEALNARYGTSILVSQQVFDSVGSAFVLRRLDKVRITGSGTSFRIFELVAEKGGLTKAMAEALEVFGTALERFEGRDWRKAETLFSQVLAQLPADGPAAAFRERCREHMANPQDPATSYLY
jgi:adenylate cyclase